MPPSPPGDELTDYQTKIPIAQVLQGQQDWRPVEALKRSLSRMKNSSDATKHAEASLLGNYVQKLEVAKALADENLSCKPDSEVRSMVEAMLACKCDLSVNIKAKLVERVAHLHLQIKNYERLLHVLNPFHTSPWDVHQPVLAGVGCEEAQLIATFQDMCFQVCLLPFIRQGKSGQKEMESFATLCIEKFNEVDVVDLSDKLALCLSETMMVMRALLAILDDDFKMDSQATRHLKKSYLGGCVFG